MGGGGNTAVTLAGSDPDSEDLSLLPTGVEGRDVAPNPAKTRTLSEMLLHASLAAFCSSSESVVDNVRS